MFDINTELNKIKNELLNGILDPFYDNSLTSFILGKSKMIRSRVAIYYLKMQEKDITTDITKILATGEIIHNASLLHDDVIDNAKFRRNESTISNKYNDKLSILSGDYLTSYAIEKLLNLSKIDILCLFKTCVQEMSLAEIEQYFLRGKVPDINKYIEICSKKTGKLFSTILESCAILTDTDCNIARNFGNSFGIYFQMLNDLQKDSAENDKLNKQYTIKDILGIEKTNYLLDDYREEIYNFLNEFPNNTFKKELKELVRTLK